MQQWQRHVDQFFGTQYEWACVESLLLQECKVQTEVQWSCDVNSEVV